MDKIVLETDDQFEISCRSHLDNMIEILKDLMDNHSIPIEFDELDFEEFVKKYSSKYNNMKIKYENYLLDLEKDENEYE